MINPGAINADNANIVDVTFETAKQYLIDESMKRPVLVDFWADWCGPCKSLAPLLEKIANEYAGAFLLARVNADELQDIAAQFGVRSLPTLIVMQQGQPVDALQGAQPEPAIKQMLAKYLPEPWEKDVAEGIAKVRAGELAEGLPLLRSAYTDSHENGQVAVALATALIHSRRLEEAEDVLKKIRIVDQGPEYHQVIAQLELAQSADKAPEITELEAQHQAKPDDLEIVQALAAQYSLHHHHKEALELLWGVLDKDLNAKNGDLKRIYMDVIATVGRSDPLAISYQQKLYSKLY